MKKGLMGKLLLTWTAKDGWDLAQQRQGKRAFQKEGKGRV